MTTMSLHHMCNMHTVHFHNNDSVDDDDDDVT